MKQCIGILGNVAIEDRDVFRMDLLRKTQEGQFVRPSKHDIDVEPGIKFGQENVACDIHAVFVKIAIYSMPGEMVRYNVFLNESVLIREKLFQLLKIPLSDPRYRYRRSILFHH